jgi:3-methyladenine DNA glycosylase AlkD
MRNQFDYYGLKSPTRRALFKEVLNKIGKPSYEEHFEIAKELYAQPQREFHYCAIELSRFNKKKWDKRLFTHHEFLATHNSWWDTVDATHSIIGSPYFQKFPAERKKLDLWNTSDNMWLIRLSIIFQLHYKDKMDTELLAKYILPHIKSEEFFIQKAIGWALRNCSRVYPNWVLDFVARTDLKPLSKREAIRLIK